MLSPSTEMATTESIGLSAETRGVLGNGSPEGTWAGADVGHNPMAEQARREANAVRMVTRRP